MRNGILMIILAAWIAAAQTQIDLRTQTKSVDFTAASSTKPLKTGATLPGTCGVGELFFNSAAPAGANFYACTAANTWTLEAGLSGATADQLSRASFCVDTGTTSTYSCSLNPPITGYSTGTTYWFKANSMNTGTATINFNGLGAKAIKKQANQDLGGGDIKAGQWVLVTYDGTNMQMQSQSGAAPVTSVFGRTGAVSAAGGDYTAAQITNAVDQTAGYSNPNWISSLAWGKLTGIPPVFTPSTHGSSHGANGADPVSLDAAQIVTGTLGASRMPASAMQNNQSNTLTAGTQDFSGAAHTLPMKSGLTAGKPGNCTVGETYFATDAAPGGNLYGCTAANTWTAQGLGATAWENSGMPAGARSTVDIIPGPGLITVLTDTGSQINFQLAIDSAVMQTQAGAQAGTNILCASTSGNSSSYTCSLNPTAQTYTKGMTLSWLPDVAGAGGAITLNIDTLGPVSVKLADGVSNPSSTSILAGELYSIWYDGSAFRLPSAALDYMAENTANKGQPNGYATLDATGKVPASQLPPSSGSGLADPGGNGVVYRNALNQTTPATAHHLSSTVTCIAASGSGTAYTCPTSPEFTPSAGDEVLLKADIANAGAATLNVNSTGAKSIRKSGGSAALATNDLLAGQWVDLVFDGTNWQMEGQTGNAASGCSMSGGAPYFAPFPMFNLAGFPVSAGVAVALIVPQCSISFSNIAFHVSTASGTSCSGGTCALAWGLYNSSGALISQTAATSGGMADINTTGYVNLSWGSTVTLTGGQAYYLAYTTNDPASSLALQRWGQSSADEEIGLLTAYATVASLGTAANSATGSGASISMPATLGSISATSNGYTHPPVVVLR